MYVRAVSVYVDYTTCVSIARGHVAWGGAGGLLPARTTLLHHPPQADDPSALDIIY
jgi:hypothetical protein